MTILSKSEARKKVVIIITVTVIIILCDLKMVSLNMEEFIKTLNFKTNQKKKFALSPFSHPFSRFCLPGNQLADFLYSIKIFLDFVYMVL